MTLSGIVAAPHHLAAAAGARVLQWGGNAFDAAVTVALATGITQPYHSGIGGGCNITYLTASGEAAHINARGPAPQQLSRDAFLEPDGKPDYERVKAGGLAVTVPSLVAGLVTLHKERGRLPWHEVCSDLMPLASDGFTADFRLASVYDHLETRDKIAHYAQASIFAKPISEGQWVTQPQLAHTLELIAQDPSTVYRGEVAQQLVATVQRAGGRLSLDDLSSYQPEVTPLQECSYRGWRVLAPGLPTIGSLQTLLALQVLDQFPLRSLGLTAQGQHLIAEVIRGTYAERASVDSDTAASALADDRVAERLAAALDLERASPTAPRDQDEHSCTSHFCVADTEGNVVSQTQTIRSHFGSGLVDPETGIVLNDSIGDFSLSPGEVTTQGIRYGGSYNLLTPGAEPASSQSPVIALQPETGDIISAGAAGGPRIVSATVQALVNQVDFGMDAQLAVALPRVHSHGAVTYLEPNSSWFAELAAMGHHVETSPSAGIAQAIRRREGSWEGGADPRGPGGVSVVLADKGVRTYGYRYE